MSKVGIERVHLSLLSVSREGATDSDQWVVVGISRIVGFWGGRFGVEMELVGQGLFVEMDKEVKARGGLIAMQ